MGPTIISTDLDCSAYFFRSGGTVFRCDTISGTFVDCSDKEPRMQRGNFNMYSGGCFIRHLAHDIITVAFELLKVLRT